MTKIGPSFVEFIWSTNEYNTNKLKGGILTPIIAESDILRSYFLYNVIKTVVKLKGLDLTMHVNILSVGDSYTHPMLYLYQYVGGS